MKHHKINIKWKKKQAKTRFFTGRSVLKSFKGLINNRFGGCKLFFYQKKPAASERCRFKSKAIRRKEKNKPNY
ncbi:MAG: hypothetical protein Kow00127_00620 [Bacteroidales bacterium]